MALIVYLLAAFTVLFVTVGCALIYVPLGWIVAGLFCAAATYFAQRILSAGS